MFIGPFIVALGAPTLPKGCLRIAVIGHNPAKVLKIAESYLGALHRGGEGHRHFRQCYDDACNRG